MTQQIPPTPLCQPSEDVAEVIPPSCQCQCRCIGCRLVRAKASPVVQRTPPIAVQLLQIVVEGLEEDDEVCVVKSQHWSDQSLLQGRRHTSLLRDIAIAGAMTGRHRYPKEYSEAEESLTKASKLNESLFLSDIPLLVSDDDDLPSAVSSDVTM